MYQLRSLQQMDTKAYIEAVPNAAKGVPVLTERQIADVKDILHSDTRLETLLGRCFVHHPGLGTLAIS